MPDRIKELVLVGLIALAAIVAGVLGLGALGAYGAEVVPTYCEGMARPAVNATCPPANPKTVPPGTEYESFVLQSEGPQIKSFDACMTYGGTLGGFVSWRLGGKMTRTAALATIYSYRGDAGLNQMIDVLEREINIVYALPGETLGSPSGYAAHWAQRCVELEGRTWLFRESL